MCNFASFVLTKTSEYYLENSNSHEDIIDFYNLSSLDNEKRLEIVKVEIIPSETPEDLSTWSFQVDQDFYPEWTFQNDPSLEERTRKALARRAKKENFFKEFNAGDYGNATVGNCGIVITGDYGTVTAGCFGKAQSGKNGASIVKTYGIATSGENGFSSSGYYGKSIAGIYGLAITETDGIATAGDYGKAITEDRGTATAGDYGMAVAGNNGTAKAGTYGNAIAEDYGKAITEFCGTSIVGNDGMAITGNRGIAIAGNGGTTSAGENGVIDIGWHDGKRLRRIIGYIGEDGIEANVAYRVDNGKLVKIEVV
jgi:hypothetical protein